MDKDDVYSKLESDLLKDRVIYMEGDFDEDTINILKRELMWCMKNQPTKPVVMYINSYGGDAYDFLSLYGLLTQKQFKLTTIALGKCMSAGAYLLLLGDKRMALPGTRIMMHEIAWESSYAKLHDQRLELKECEHIQNILNKLTAEKTKIKEISSFLEEDKYLSPEEAYKLGIINVKP